MAEIERNNTNEVSVSNFFLRRLQIPTDPALNKCSYNLFVIFCKKFGCRKEEFRSILSMPTEVANQFLSVAISNEELGFNSGKNPTRVYNEIEGYLDSIFKFPFVVVAENKQGKETYLKLPLIKGHAKTEKNKHLVIFNDLLYYAIFPEEKYGRCSLEILEKMRNKSPFAVILYEEGCSRQFDLCLGGNPWFEFSEKKLREKFLFVQIISVDSNFENYDIKSIKGMRIDKIRSMVLKPALRVIEDFFNAGKISFRLKMSESTTKKVGRGRPKKSSNFHFWLDFSHEEEISPDNKCTILEGELFFDSETLQTVKNISTELTKALNGSGFLMANSYIATVTAQLKNRLESQNPDKELPKMISDKIREIRSRYQGKGAKAISRNIVNALWQDFQLGNKPKKTTAVQSSLIFWPDVLEEKIALMQQSNDLVREVAELFGITSDEVISLLGTFFYERCKKERNKLKDWKDAKSFFINWLKYFLKNRNNNGNEQQQTNNNMGKIYSYFSQRSTRE